MININYEINGPLFPFEFALQHFAAIRQETEWKGRIVHLILGCFELIPPINYIIAIFDAMVCNAISAQAQHQGALPQPPQGFPPGLNNGQWVPPQLGVSVEWGPGGDYDAELARAIEASKGHDQRNDPFGGGESDDELSRALALSAEEQSSIRSRVPAVQQKNSPAPPSEVQSLKDYLAQMTNGLAFGLTSSDRSLESHLKDLRRRGIHTVEDLHALFEFEGQLGGYETPLASGLETLRLLETYESQPSDCCKEQLDALAKLEVRANPDPQKRNPLDLRKVRSELCTVRDALLEHVQEVLDAGSLGDLLGTWSQLSSDIAALEEPLGRQKNNWKTEREALVAIAERIQAAESERQKALYVSQQTKPLWKELQTVVVALVKRLQFLDQIEAGFVPGQFSDAEVAIFNDMRGQHQNALTQMRKLAETLKQFDLEALQRQIEQVQAVLQPLSDNAQLERIVLLRLYVVQVNCIQAWKNLATQGITNLARYREIYPNNNLYEIGVGETPARKS